MKEVYQKALKKLTLFFLSYPAAFNEENIKNKHNLELMTSCYSGHETSSKKFFFLVIFYLTKSDDFQVIQKI